MERRELNVELRTKTRKGANRKLRRAGRIPGIFYGSHRPTVSLSLDPMVLHKALESKSGLNTLLDLRCDSAEVNGMTVILKDFQMDPITEDMIHVDLIEVDLSKPLEVAVPLRFDGQAAGVTKGGILESILRDIEISSLPEHIPDEYVLDVSALEIGNALHVKDIAFGPDITVLSPLEDIVVTVVAPKMAEEKAAPVEGEEAAAEGEEAAKPEEKKEEKDKEKDKEKEKK